MTNGDGTPPDYTIVFQDLGKDGVRLIFDFKFDYFTIPPPLCCCGYMYEAVIVKEIRAFEIRLIAAMKERGHKTARAQAGAKKQTADFMGGKLALPAVTKNFEEGPETDRGVDFGGGDF